jgi:hypothetical protein
MVKRIWDITRKYGNNFLIYVDSNNPEIWEECKRSIGEEDDNKLVTDKLDWCRGHNVDPSTVMKVIPCAFNATGAAMLQHAKSILDSGEIAIHPRFKELLLALRTATANEFKLIKKDTSYHDVLDAFRLSLNRYDWEN